MALDGVIKTAISGTTTLYDGTTPTPVSLALILDLGDFSFGPLGVGGVLNEVVKIERRGKFVSSAFGARIYPSGKFSCYLAESSNASNGVVTDFVGKTGFYASNLTTSSGGTSMPYTVDIWFHVEGTQNGGADSDWYLSDCTITMDSIDEAVDGNKVSFSFECLGKVYRGTSRSGTVIAQQVS